RRAVHARPAARPARGAVRRTARRRLDAPGHDDGGGLMARILIAEDEPRIASFLVKGLGAAGFTTTAVSDGETAAACARDEDFDLLILDLGLPKLDGHAVLRTIRERGQRLPVVILTARHGVSDKVDGF